MKKGIFSILFLISCSIKPNIPFETIQQGENLEKIPLVSLDEFFQLWLQNQKYPKMWRGSILKNFLKIKSFNTLEEKNGIVLFPYLSGVFSKFKKKF